MLSALPILPKIIPMALTGSSINFEHTKYILARFACSRYASCEHCVHTRAFGPRVGENLSRIFEISAFDQYPITQI